MDLDRDTIDWLLEGDPSIRWQVKRDLLDKPYKTERRLVAQEGWGRRLLDLQCDDGRWTEPRGPNGFRGLYTPKWTSTTYTLLLLRRFGVPTTNGQCRDGCSALVDGSRWFDNGSVGPWSSLKTDLCVCGMFLGLLTYFDHDSDEEQGGLLSFILGEQKEDGGWNCRDGSTVSSVHTTMSVLEALQIVQQRSPNDTIDRAMTGGHDYLLQRKLFRSLRTGDVIQANFKRFSFPPRWKYDIMRALDHFQEADVRDDRLQEAIDLVVQKQTKQGRWKLQNRHSGETFFEMEKPGQASRWNTLRALRVLRWWNA